MSLLGMKELNSIQHMPSEAGLAITQWREGNLVVESVCACVCVYVVWQFLLPYCHGFRAPNRTITHSPVDESKMIGRVFALLRYELTSCVSSRL